MAWWVGLAESTETLARSTSGGGPLAAAILVADSSAESSARLNPGGAGGSVAVAARQLNGYTSVYSSVLQLPAQLLHPLAQRAGGHLYADAGNVVMAGNGFVGIHATTAGTRTLRLPAPAGLTDVVTGQELPAAGVFEFAMDVGEGDTRLFQLGAPR